MGGKQSRVEASDVETELHAHEARGEGEVRASIRLTPALVDQIKHPEGGASSSSAPVHLDAQCVPPRVDNGSGVHTGGWRVCVVRQTAGGAQEAAAAGVRQGERERGPSRREGGSDEGDDCVCGWQGAEDFRKEMEAKQKQAPAQDSVAQAKLAKEQEARENARVAALIADINQKKYRAPINDVQCAPERDACLQCYRDQQSDVLKCKEVADAFVRCAQVHTEVRPMSIVSAIMSFISLTLDPVHATLRNSSRTSKAGDSSTRIPRRWG